MSVRNNMCKNLASVCKQNSDNNVTVCISCLQLHDDCESARLANAKYVKF